MTATKVESQHFFLSPLLNMPANLDELFIGSHGFLLNKLNH